VKERDRSGLCLIELVGIVASVYQLFGPERRQAACRAIGSSWATVSYHMRVARHSSVCYCHTVNECNLGTIRAMTTSVLSVRVNEEERALLAAASELARTSLSDFVRRKALDAAEADIVERRIITIPARDWEAFETWANRPPEEIAGLKDLARTTPKWQK